MKPLTLEWVAKAEADFASAGREQRARKMPNYDAACFHSQQCAEKYLKAILQEESIAFERTHKLVALLDLLAERYPEMEPLRPSLVILTAYAVAFRYPEESADYAMAREAVALCKEIRRVVRSVLGLH